jgi:hypothetical protein
MKLMQKTYLFSVQIEMSLESALKSVGYTDAVLFLTIGKSDIYQHICKFRQVDNSAFLSEFWKTGKSDH